MRGKALRLKAASRMEALSIFTSVSRLINERLIVLSRNTTSFPSDAQLDTASKLLRKGERLLRADSIDLTTSSTEIGVPSENRNPTGITKRYVRPSALTEKRSAR